MPREDKSRRQKPVLQQQSLRRVPRPIFAQLPSPIYYLACRQHSFRLHYSTYLPPYFAFSQENRLNNMSFKTQLYQISLPLYQLHQFALFFHLSAFALFLDTRFHRCFDDSLCRKRSLSISPQSEPVRRASTITKISSMTRAFRNFRSCTSSKITFVS